MRDNRKADLVKLAHHLSTQYCQYERGAHYLLQLAGMQPFGHRHWAATVKSLACASCQNDTNDSLIWTRGEPPPRLNFLLSAAAPRQRVRPILADGEPHNVHKLRVTFRRHV